MITGSGHAGWPEPGKLRLNRVAECTGRNEVRFACLVPIVYGKRTAKIGTLLMSPVFRSRLPAAFLLLGLFGFSMLHAGEPGSSDEVESLRQQIERMQAELVALQHRLDRLESVESRSRSEPLSVVPGAAGDGSVDALESRVATLEDQQVEPDPSGIEFGGAVRLNYAWRDYDEDNKDRAGDFEIELFRINVDGAIGEVLLSAEWRRYNDFQAIHHGWLGYDFSETLQGQVGIHQVPFGLLPYASHSFWFGGTYYLGFEDDYDTGVKFIHRPNDDWTMHYAFYKNPEYASDSRFGRYSFDLVTGGEQQNSEINQLNFRAERHLALGADATVDLGVSLEGGQIWNEATRSKGDRWAVAAHLNADVGLWNMQLQGLRYDFNPDNPADVSEDFVQTGAFDFPFLMAAEANVYSINLARSLPVSLGPVDGMTCYNDLTLIDPRVSDSAESIQNVTGCSVSAGGVFAYFDWIAGKNMWFAGGDGIGLNGVSAGRWRSRFNINLGFYF